VTLNGSIEGTRPRITGFCFVLELDAVCVGTSDGDILTVNVETQSVEVVGSVDGGVTALQWSPDGERIGIVGGFGQFMLMDQVRDRAHFTSAVNFGHQRPRTHYFRHSHHIT
jgi:Tol biopolymer transport system component